MHIDEVKFSTDKGLQDYLDTSVDLGDAALEVMRTVRSEIKRRYDFAHALDHLPNYR